jgi:hypothetical protein
VTGVQTCALPISGFFSKSFSKNVISKSRLSSAIAYSPSHNKSILL